MVFGLAVLTVIVLIRVIDDDPASLGVNTAGSQDNGDSTATTTTLPPGVTTTRPGGTTTTTAPTIDTTGKPTLQTGSTGADVTLVQETLTRLGYYNGQADGQYGQGTAAAVAAFQTAEGISPADGVVGPATWQALATA